MSKRPLRATLEGDPEPRRLQGTPLFFGVDPDARGALGPQVEAPAAALVPCGDRAVVVALGDGLFLNRRRQPAGSTRTLRAGDRLRVGEAVVWVHALGAAPGEVRRRSRVGLGAGLSAALVLAVATSWAAWPSPAPLPVRPQDESEASRAKRAAAEARAAARAARRMPSLVS
ncbi:MAG: hypothetical protein KDD82_10185, partial [Planctomycetes bacterium]|nr:hypothetical protein [Planctomycetota bacterium]